jgi:hypothetical protein
LFNYAHGFLVFVSYKPFRETLVVD